MPLNCKTNRTFLFLYALKIEFGLSYSINLLGQDNRILWNDHIQVKKLIFNAYHCYVSIYDKMYDDLKIHKIRVSYFLNFFTTYKDFYLCILKFH